ncbi:uncharacterized protein YbjT (DUF2867 family) [Rhizobium leguminosarum]|nr:uncharacterized protein YbjT (DUF2867 family) [Rhizobium leguminosarum]
MKIVIIGGTGLIGSKTVERLRSKGHDVLPASPNSGVDTITGKGLAEALAGAQVVSTSPTPPPSRTRRFSNSSRPRAATCSRQGPPPA